MGASAKAIFLSYASQDVDVARRICDALRAVGLDVWFDQSALRGGDAWDASIRRQIRECALFVPVISASTQAREEGYFRLEWKLAVDRSHQMADDKAFLLPVVIDATTEDHARVPEKFLEVQWTHLPAGAIPTVFAEMVYRLLSGAAAQPHAEQLHATHATGATAAPLAARAQQLASIAVLPFVNRSHDEDDEYFSDGLADELLNVLAKIRGLRVAARSSAFTFKGKGATVAEVGRALNVATVLEGSVRKAANRMRISVQLVKVADGYQLWSETYDRTLEDIFAVQDDIAQSVVKELRAMLLGEAADANANKAVDAQVAAAVKGRSTDPEAHRLFLQGRYFIDRLDREDTKRGIEYLQEAVALDPRFALAWAALGAAHTQQSGATWAPVAEGIGRARQAVARALVLEPDLAEAHAEMAWIHIIYERDWRAAESSYRRALELAPGNAAVLRGAAWMAGNLGRLDEAILLVRGVLEQDPLSAHAYSNLGYFLHASGRFDEADAAYRKALEISPQRISTHVMLARNLLAQGRGDEALAEALREPEEWYRLYASAIIHHAAGRRVESDAALQELIANHAAECAYQVAEVYAACGGADSAFEWLDRAYDQRDAGIVQMKPDPLLRSLHADPRWDAFLHKMGLAD